VTRGRKEASASDDETLAALLLTHVELVTKFTSSAKSQQYELKLLMDATSVEIESFVKLQQLMKLVCSVKAQQYGGGHGDDTTGGGMHAKDAVNETGSQMEVSTPLSPAESAPHKERKIVRKGSGEKLTRQRSIGEKPVSRHRVTNGGDKAKSGERPPPPRPTRVFEDSESSSNSSSGLMRESLDLPPAARPARAPRAQAVRNKAS